MRDLSRLLHIAISLGGTEMKRKPVFVCNETTCSQSWNPGMSTRDWETLQLAPLLLYKAGAGGIPSESRKLG